ncbi:MAG: hypothetical protein ACREFW_11375, partial [Rhizomicrobium sp.]
MRFVRITCLPINAPGERPIMVDAVLSPNDEIAGSQPLFGTWGRIGRENEYYPLILREDGVIDYGAALEEGDRYFDFDLRGGKIAVNRV